MFRFPLLVFPLAAGIWFFLTDLLSGGGDWTAVLSILVGLMLLSWAVAADRGSTSPFAFWLHVVAGLTIGGGLLWLFHDGDWDWILIGLVALLYIWIGDRLVRSSWVVLGAWGFLQSTAHFAVNWANSLSPAFFVVFYLFPFTLLDAFGDEGSPSGRPRTRGRRSLLPGRCRAADGARAGHRPPPPRDDPGAELL